MKLLRRWLSMFIKAERGAVIILVALLLVFVLLGMAVLTVDVGYLYLQKRHLQTTADSAALAAAWELPWENPAIEATALEYTGYNGIINGSDGANVIVSRAYENSAVKVEITKNYPLFFALAPPIGQTNADVYAMAVAIREPTFIDLLPFLLLKYEGIIDENEYDIATWGSWDKDTFYNVMKDSIPSEIVLWINSSAGNWGVADMRAFAGLDTNGNVNASDIQYILKHGLIEPFCVGNRPRSGKAGVIAAIDTNVPASVDGFTIRDRLDRDDDFFIVLILPGLAGSFQGSHSSFGLNDFIIGHVRPLEKVNKNLVGTLIEVYKDCSEIPDEYKMWRPILIE